MGVRTYNDNIIRPDGTPGDPLIIDYVGRQLNQIDSVISSSITQQILNNSTVTFSSPFADEYSNIETLFNNDETSGHLLFNSGDLPIILDIDLGDDYIFNFSRISTGLGDLQSAVREWNLQISNDGINFTTIYTKGIDFSTTHIYTTGVLNPPPHARYLKYTFISTTAILPTHPQLPSQAWLDYFGPFDTEHFALTNIKVQYNPTTDQDSPGSEISNEYFLLGDPFNTPEMTTHTQWNTFGYTLPYPAPVASTIFMFIFNTTNITGLTNSDFQTALTPILNIIKNNEGLFYWPEFGFDGIVDLEPGQGYQMRIKDSANSTSTITLSNGVTYTFSPNVKRSFRLYTDQVQHFNFTPPTIYPTHLDFINAQNTTPMGLHPQWNTIAFNRYFPQTTEDALWGVFYPNPDLQPPNSSTTEGAPTKQKILSDIFNIVKNNEGLFYWPEFAFDGIVTLKPGQGYQMRIRDGWNADDHKSTWLGSIDAEFHLPPDDPEEVLVGIPLWLESDSAI